MKFFELAEPRIATAHVLIRTPLLYRLDARNTPASFVITEYVDRPPAFELNGDFAECHRLFRRCLSVLNDPHEVSVWHGSIPLFTLDMRSAASPYEAMIFGFLDGSVKIVSHGAVPVGRLAADVGLIGDRLTALGRVYYAE